MCDREQHDTSNNWGYAKKRQSWTLLLGPSCKSRSSHGCDDLNSAEGNIEKDGVEAIKPKAFHNQGTKRCDATAGNSTSD